MKFLIEITDEIKHFEEYVTVTKTNGKIVEGIYKMTLIDLLQELEDATERSKEAIESPMLPSNCIKFIWRDISTKQSDVYVCVPKTRWNITFLDVPLQQVGFPKMVFKYKVANQRVDLSTIVAVKDTGPITNQTPLYHFPFSHVNTDGQVCMGGNTFPPIERIQQLETFHHLFLNSPFGTDYGAKSITGLRVEQLFQQLVEKDFTDDWLLPITKGVFNEEHKKYMNTHLTFGEHFSFAN